MWWLIAVPLVSGLFLYKRRKNQLAFELQKPDFEKDVIYLVQFPVSPNIRTISPFSLKVETYLRLKKIRYEPIYSFKFGRKGQVPYIELNGEQIPDSNHIIQELERRGIAAADDITTEQTAINHVVKVTVENHTALTSFYWRYGFNMEELYEKLCIPYWPTGKFGLFMFKQFQPLFSKIQAATLSSLRHPMNEIVDFATEDLKTFSVLLGDKPFFNGDKPSTIDCTMFGHLVQLVLLPMEIPHKKFIVEECPNLVEFVERMKSEFWPDWEEMCSGECMEGKRHKTAM